jgi:hypothetical protein
MLGRVVKPKARKPETTREAFINTFPVKGPATVETNFVRYCIGKGDKTNFYTDAGGEIVIERVAPNVIRVLSYKRSFIPDRVGENSDMYLKF